MANLILRIQQIVNSFVGMNELMKFIYFFVKIEIISFLKSLNDIMGRENHRI